MSTATAGRHGYGPLPTLEGVYEVTNRMLEVYEDIEHIAGSVKHIVEAWEVPDGNPPTPEDIGVLYIFASHVKVNADHSTTAANEVLANLLSLEGMRRDAPRSGNGEGR